MTRDEITARVHENLNDFGVFYTADDVNDSIQDGYDEVAVSTGCILKAISIDFVANLVYYDLKSLITDFHAVTAIFNAVTKQWLTPISLRKLQELRWDWEVAPGNSFAFWPINWRYIAVYPRPTSAVGKLYVYYRATAPILAGSTEPLIADEYQDVLEQYVTMDLYEQAEEFTKASLQFKEYLSTLQKLKASVRNFKLPDKMYVLS